MAPGCLHAQDPPQGTRVTDIQNPPMRGLTASQEKIHFHICHLKVIPNSNLVLGTEERPRDLGRDATLGRTALAAAESRRLRTLLMLQLLPAAPGL